MHLVTALYCNCLLLFADMFRLNYG